MQFYISPSAGHANVEVCVLPVPRAQEDEEFTIDDIKTRGSCTHEMDANGQYFLSFELEPASYTALIYAHSDYSFVSIPALSPLLQGNRYAFQFTMQSCDNTASFEDSDSYSVTISNSYVWSGAEPPRVVVYYTSDLSLTLKDIALFSKKEFTGMTGLANHLFQIAGLEPFTEYQIYVFVEEASGSSTVRPLVSNRVLATTYGLCTDGDWPAVGVGMESHLSCTIGYHAFYCSKSANFNATFTTRRDACYCPEETINGFTYNQTAYGDYVIDPMGKRMCGWRGVWDPLPSMNCKAEGPWPATYDGQYAVLTCDNQGSLRRLCRAGQWQEIEDMNCNCGRREEDGIVWNPANREETMQHACMSGTVTRRCSFYGQWEEPIGHDCQCTEDGMWGVQNHNSSQTRPCGEAGTPGNVVTRVCGFNGFWGEEDLSQCACDPKTENEITWEATLVNTAAWIRCEIGSKARICVPYGFWDTQIGDYGCMCAADMGWPDTPSGTDVALPCPDNAAKFQRRRCMQNGVWGDVDSIGCYGSCPAYGRFPVTLSGTTASIACEEGGGLVLMDCLRKVDANGEFYGEWDFESWRVEGECRCKSVDEFPSAFIDTDSVIQCDSGSRTQRCGRFTARWEKPVNHDCMCTVTDAPAEMPVIWTPLFETATVDCDVGSRTAYCGGYGHYENQDASQCFCGANSDFAQTMAGAMGSASCSEVGSLARECSDSGFWGVVDYSGCSCRGLDQITGHLTLNSTYNHECPVGGYTITCSETGTTVPERTNCSCPAVNGFPETPAGTNFAEQCGSHSKTAYCDLFGEWKNMNNTCFCPATSLFPKAGYGEFVEAYLPQCYKGYCNPDTGVTEIDYSGCSCAAMDQWPAMEHGMNMTMPCVTGGIATAVCEMGVLRVNYEDCNCLDGSGNEVEVGDYLNFPCMIGFILKQCRGNNTWFHITDSYCGCSSNATGLSLFEIMDANTTKEVPCGAGTMSITCDATGHFDLDSLVNQCKCPAEDLWSETEAGGVATVTCVNSPMNGARRECGEFGVWGEAALPCQCPADGEWSAQLAGIHEIICENGAKITRECQVDGSWLPPNGSCRDNSCPADSVFPITPHLGTYAYTCGNGHVVTRTCTAGVWSAVDWSGCGCAADGGFDAVQYIDPALNSITAFLSCGYGQRTRRCTSGQWEAVNYDDCFCASFEALPLHAANATYSRLCGSGSIDAFCDAAGNWTILQDSCGCAEDADTVEDVVFPAVPRGESVSVACLSGAMRRQCSRAAEWEPVDYADCRCVAEGWTEALPTEEGRQACEEGYLTRVCKPNGQWDAISSASCACSANELFDRTVVSAFAVHYCGVGSVRAECTVAGWANEEDDGCACAATSEYPITPRYTIMEVPCGALFEGTKRRECLATGFWSEEEDVSRCVPWCIEVGEWPATRPNSTVVLDCPAEGYSEGSITRYCNPNGLWEAGVSTCTPLKCEAEDGFPTTPFNQTASKACPEGMVGSITRRCSLVGSVAQWDEVEDNCQDAFCTIGDNSYAHNETVTLSCAEGMVGRKVQVCRTGVWEVLEDTCVAVVCPADEAAGYPEGHFGQVFHKNCDVDYSGMITYRCNAYQQWEYVTGSCQPILPMLRCVPADGATDVALSTMTDANQYTIYCTSNVRVGEVINDQFEHMNIHIVFELEEATFSYPTTAISISDYTIGFAFEGSFPPSCEGTLYITANCFVSRNGLTFPSETLIATFSTRAGVPLAPPPIQEGAIRITDVDYAHRSVSLQIDVPYSSAIYDEAQIAFIGSNLQSQFFQGRSVFVEGAILNSVIPITWRVRKGAYWSAFASFSVYRPVVLLPPSAPVVAAFEATQVRWTWSAGELFGQAFVGYHYQLFAADALLREGDVQQAELALSLDAGVAYSLRVALCSAECSILSEASAPITLSAYVVAPGAVRNLQVTALSSSSLRVQWAEPAELGGASIQYYVVRRSSMASMAVIESEVATSSCFLDLQNLQSLQHTPVYLSVAAFNGYLSRQEKITAVLEALAVEWRSNQDEGIQWDSAVAITGSFNYLCTATCELRAPAYPSFRRTVSFPAGREVSHVFDGLIPATSYTIECRTAEVGSAESLTTHISVSTIATSEFVPVLVVDGEPTSSLTVSVSVTTNLLGDLVCYVAPYEGLQSRPASLNLFLSNWAQNRTVASVTDPIHFLFAYDVTGALIRADLVYHAWCAVGRDVSTIQTDGSVRTDYVVFPDYADSTVPRSALRLRRTLQTTPFEVLSISPAEFARDVDPHSDIVLTFSLPAERGTGSISLRSSANHVIRVEESDVSCVYAKCTLRLSDGLLPFEKYVMNVDADAFLAQGQAQPLQKEVRNWFFQTGGVRCDTRFVGRGMGDAKMCQCFSVENACQCECGETSVLREL